MLLAKMRGGHAWLRANRLANLLGPTKEEEEGVSTLDLTVVFPDVCRSHTELRSSVDPSFFSIWEGADLSRPDSLVADQAL